MEKRVLELAKVDRAEAAVRALHLGEAGGDAAPEPPAAYEVTAWSQRGQLLVRTPEERAWRTVVCYLLAARASPVACPQLALTLGPRPTASSSCTARPTRSGQWTR